MSGKVPNEAVQVVVRCRPMSASEIKNEYENIIDVDASRGTIEITNSKISNQENLKRTFTYDAVFDETSTQNELYECIRPLISSVLEGFNGTVFAYGQTGTGKTYTMEGYVNDPEEQGIIWRTFDHIFSHIGRSANQQFLLRVSYLEIYQEEIRDLLQENAGAKCEIHERADTGVFIKNLSVKCCNSIEEIGNLMAKGNECRSTGATNMNEHSSRSHAILTITVEMIDVDISPPGIRVGKLNLVDLAGSERQGKSGATGVRLKEANKINLSLSALGNVISALVDGRTTHVPYRDSKLTRLLQDSLGGNSKTVMVANIGPASYNYEETLTTLRYANRAKNIKNKPKVNEDPKDALIRKYREEIELLHVKLAEKRSKTQVDKKSSMEGIVDLMNRDNKTTSDMQESCNEEWENQMAEDERITLELEAKISAIESKVLCGGKNIIDHTNEQQRALELQNQEIAEKKKMEVLMRQKLEHQEDTALEMYSSFTSLQQEVEFRTKRLRRVFTKLQTTKQELHDSNEEFNRDRRELEETENLMLREFRRKGIVIDNFIPLEENTKIANRLHYDESSDEWMTRPLDVSDTSVLKRPISSEGRRPFSDYSLNMSSSSEKLVRYQPDNLVGHDMVARQRTTLQYEAPTVAPKIQAVLDQALMVEDDLDIDASNIVTVISETRGSSRPGTSGAKKKTNRSLSSSASRPEGGHPSQTNAHSLKSSRGCINIREDMLSVRTDLALSAPAKAVSGDSSIPQASSRLEDNKYPKARGLVPKK